MLINLIINYYLLDVLAYHCFRRFQLKLNCFMDSEFHVIKCGLLCETVNWNVTTIEFIVQC